MEDLVIEKYLRKVPIDPIHNSNEWALIHFEPIEIDIDPEIAEGIIDVKSRSDGIALDGTSYAEW